METPPVKVLHIITRLIVGGAQENTIYTAALLDQRRFAVEVLSGPQTGSEGSLIEETRERGIPLTILPNLVRQVSPINDLLALWKLTRLMRQRRFQIVHTHSSKAGILGRLAARLAGVPVIVHTVHGWSFHDYMSPFVRSTYITLERWMATFSDALIVVTNKDIEKGLRHNIGRANQYRLIRSAVPLDEFDPSAGERSAARKEFGIPDDAIVVGTIGRFSEQKNPFDWARVAARVSRVQPGVWFLLVGDGPLRSDFEELLRKEGIADKTVLAGLRRDVPRMISGIDIFLLTSLWEGLPRVIPQAMAMGIPVIANQVDGIAEAIQDEVTGYLCPPGDLDRMAERCVRLINQPDLRREMGLRGRSYATQEFDLQRMIEQIEALYFELAEEKALPLNR
jgi:glycosyltransferase involved in cell wall biosynthesis